MSRQEDFKRMAHSHDTESSKYEQQFYIDGADDGYEYAVDKACEWLEQHAYLYVDDIDQLHESALIGDFRLSMED